MNKKIGFVGMGNMASAIAEGFITSGKVLKENMGAYAPHYDKLKKNAGRIGFKPYDDLKALFYDSDIVILACKPYQIEEALYEAEDAVDDKAIISIAAGWNYADFQEITVGRGSWLANARFQCIMPNTPAKVGEGVLLFEEENSRTDGELFYVRDIFEALGIVETIPTELMAAGGAVTGCAPAFMDMIIEAYADAAVKYGFPRKLAYRLVEQTMLGSARLALETEEHPGVLKDQVCSPGGTTIRGVEALEKAGLRSACMQSIEAVMKR